MILQRIRIIVRDAGFEPGTSAPEVWCAINEPSHLTILLYFFKYLKIWISTKNLSQWEQSAARCLQNKTWHILLHLLQLWHAQFFMGRFKYFLYIDGHLEAVKCVFFPSLTISNYFFSLSCTPLTFCFFFFFSTVHFELRV